MQKRNTGAAEGKAKKYYHNGNPAKGDKKKRRVSSNSIFRRFVIVLVTTAVLLGGGAYGFHVYQERYPKEQRCPPEGDRFHDHCKEGRKHYVLSLDWSCLGPRRAEAMRMALSLPSDGKPLRGVGEIPSWLTEENAKALSGAPCMKGIVLDMACRYCKPSKKPTKQSNEALAAQAAEVLKKQKAAAGGSSEGTGSREAAAQKLAEQLAKELGAASDGSGGAAAVSVLSEASAGAQTSDGDDAGAQQTTDSV